MVELGRFNFATFPMAIGTRSPATAGIWWTWRDSPVPSLSKETRDLPDGYRDALASYGRNLVDLAGFEPATSSMPWKRAPSCATGPRPTQLQQAPKEMSIGPTGPIF